VPILNKRQRWRRSLCGGLAAGLLIGAILSALLWRASEGTLRPGEFRAGRLYGAGNVAWLASVPFGLLVVNGVVAIADIERNGGARAVDSSLGLVLTLGVLPNFAMWGAIAGLALSARPSRHEGHSADQQ
jgi:hypothetical protein